MKHELNIQANPTTSLCPVRVLRCQGENLIGSPRGVDSSFTLAVAITTFKREFPGGVVQVETLETCEVRAYRVTDNAWLFNHPATYVPSL